MSSSQVVVFLHPDIKMGAFLVKKKKPVTSTKDHEEVIARLNQARHRLSLHCQRSELIVENDRHQAKQMLREGKREEAETLIKKKICHERQLHQSHIQLDKLDQMTDELELARLALELNNFGERKVKRGRWKSIIKRKHKRRQNSRSKLGKPVHEDIEIQVLDLFSHKERDKRNKIVKESRKCIIKQKKIDNLLSGQLSRGDETAVEKELEAIMNAGYQMPNLDQGGSEICYCH